MLKTDGTDNSASMLLKWGISMKIEEIEIDGLLSAPKEWNYFLNQADNEDESLKESIRAIGQQNPIIVWKNPKLENLPYQKDELPTLTNGEDYYVILCGHRRVKIFRELYNPDDLSLEKYAVIQAIIYEDISNEIAREIMVDENSMRRKKHKYESLKLLEAKIETYCIDYELLMSRERSEERLAALELLVTKTGFSSKWILRLSSLIKLPEELKEWILVEYDASINLATRFAKSTNDSLQQYLKGKVLRNLMTADIFDTIMLCISDGKSLESIEKALKKGRLKRPIQEKRATLSVPMHQKSFAEKIIKAIEQNPEVERRIKELLMIEELDISKTKLKQR